MRRLVEKRMNEDGSSGRSSSKDDSQEEIKVLLHEDVSQNTHVPACSRAFQQCRRLGQKQRVALLLTIVLLGVSAVVVAIEGHDFDEGSVSEMRMASRSSSHPEIMIQQQPKTSSGMLMNEGAEDTEMMLPTKAHKGVVTNRNEAMDETLGTDMLHNWEETIQEIKEGAQKVDRMLVFNGDISLLAEPDELDHLTNKIVMIVKKNGFVENQSTSMQTYSSGPRLANGERKKTRIMDLRLRIPSDSFETTVSDIKRLFQKDENDNKRIVRASTNSRDVTEQYIDATARADTLEASLKALQALMARSTTVKDVMEVQRELNQVTQQYESQRSRAKYLQKQASMGSLSVHIEEIVPDEYNIEPNDWWDPAGAVWLGLEHIGTVLGFVGSTVIYAAIW
eukprot:CAMPEP_0198282132 /NCGR_PEP_ID=MMETSP1449-20131203/1971_1 /TAXON_ID=420275 /ORGANISM="Attheya septentrionalis, Strain CCMP2084" /LENGTH=393 /DNA_ID=CAMNT_0043978229 /DNA_START=83 /DNA_END=1261 /DNA_ORIENTATION=+